jgi:recombination protein RecT
MTVRQRQQPEAGQALAQRRENGGTDEARVSLRQAIEKMAPEFQRAMPRGREADQLVRDAITCLRSVKKLAECDPTSVLGALMTCAQLNLRPQVLGQAYILPFWDSKANPDPNGGRPRGGHKAQIIIGYQGLIDLAMRSGRVDSVIARIVYEGDLFEVDYGLDSKLVHRPAMFRDGYVEDPNREPDARAYYAIVKYKGGGSAFWVMSKAQALRHARRYSKQKTREGDLFGVWKDNFDEMAQKTCVRMLAKFMPKSAEFEALTQGLQVDEGVRLNYTPNADPTEVTSPADDYIEGDVVEPVSGPPAQDAQEPPPIDEWPAVVPAGGTS